MILKLSLFCAVVTTVASLPQQYDRRQQGARPFQQQQPFSPQQQQPAAHNQFQPPQQQQPQQRQYTEQSKGPSQPPVPIISLDNNINYDGSYQYSYEGGDGSKQEQYGQLKSIGGETGEVSQGSYSYVGDDGRTYSVQYTADETGYHPVGDHLPQPPPIPEAILKSLEYLATAPPPKDLN